MSRNTVERRELIKELLIKNGSINSSDASSRFSVSTETIRKDLIFLERGKESPKKLRRRSYQYRLY